MKSFHMETNWWLFDGEISNRLGARVPEESLEVPASQKLQDYKSAIFQDFEFAFLSKFLICMLQDYDYKVCQIYGGICIFQDYYIYITVWLSICQNCGPVFFNLCICICQNNRSASFNIVNLHFSRLWICSFHDYESAFVKEESPCSQPFQPFHNFAYIIFLKIIPQRKNIPTLIFLSEYLRNKYLWNAIMAIKFCRQPSLEFVLFLKIKWKLSGHLLLNETS